MSWLQSRTVTTFHDLNPDWEITVFVPAAKSGSAVKYIPDYLGFDHFPAVKELPYVKIVTVDLAEYGIGEHLPDILRSDILRYQLLYRNGGVWSDFDVVWIKPMSEFGQVQGLGGALATAGATVCLSQNTTGWHNIGVMMSLPGHPLYAELIKICQERSDRSADGRALDHQEFGVTLLNGLYPTLGEVQQRYPDVVGVPYDIFYPYPVFNLEALWLETKLESLHDQVMCVHWFNGHPLSKDFVNGRGREGASMSVILNRHVVKQRALHPPAAGRGEAPGEVRYICHHRRDLFFHDVLKFIRPTGKVLDLGCGIRPMTFFRPLLHIMADVHDEYVQMLRHQYAHLPSCLVLQGDALQVLKSFPDGGLDSIFLLDVIEHLPKEVGLEMIREMERVAAVQIVIFTPLGFIPQECAEEGHDGWGLSGTAVQRHQSGWGPEDFPADWQHHVCRDFHRYNWKGEPTPPFGAFFAIKTKLHDATISSPLTDRQKAAVRFMPVLEPSEVEIREDRVQKEFLELHRRLDGLTHSFKGKLTNVTHGLKKVEKVTGKLEKAVLKQQARSSGRRRLWKKIMLAFKGRKDSL